MAQPVQSASTVAASADTREFAPMKTTVHVDGLVAPGFEEVRAQFERNFAERGEIGAAVTAYWRGKKVVDRGAAAARPKAMRHGTGTPWLSSCPPPRASRR